MCTTWLKNVEVKSFNSRDEWLEFRRSHVGASDVPMIFGRSQYGNIDDFVDSKVGAVKEQDQWIVKEKTRGEEAAEQLCYLHTLSLEDRPIDLDQRKMQYVVSGTVDVGNPYYDIPICASFDVVHSYRNNMRVFIVYEIKCVEEASEGEGVPNKYFHQMLHQQYVLNGMVHNLHRSENGAYALFYVEFSEKQNEILKIVPFHLSVYDYEREVIPEIIKAVGMLNVKRLQNAVSLSADYLGEKQEFDHSSVEELIEKYNVIAEQLEAEQAKISSLEKKASAIKKSISDLIGNKKYSHEFGDYKVNKIKVSGTIDVEKIPLNININEIRKPPSYQLRITKSKDKKLKGRVTSENGRIELR